MGHRANYLIQRGGDYELFESQRGALTIPRDLFWGPDYAEAFVRRHDDVSRGEWLNDVEGEGGAVLDDDTDTIVLFGGERLAHPPYREAFLELMRALWSYWGWTVDWAEWGIPDLAEQVGEDPLAYTSGPKTAEPPPPEAFGARYERRERITSLITVVEDGETDDRVAGHDIDDLLAIGPSMLEGLDQLTTLDRVRDEYEPPDYLVSGDDGDLQGVRRSLRSYLVVDRDRKRLDFRGYVRLGEFVRLEEAWRDTEWTLERHTLRPDYMKRHFEQTGREVPADLADDRTPPSRAEILETVAACLAEEHDVTLEEEVRRRLEATKRVKETTPPELHALDDSTDGRPDAEVCRERFRWALTAIAED